MRYIQLKKVFIESNEAQKGPDKFIDYKAHILGMVSTYPEGALIEELRRHTKLYRKVRSANPEGLLKLEDAEHEAVMKKLNAVRWAFNADEIVDFCDAIEFAPETEPAIEEKAMEAASGD